MRNQTVRILALGLSIGVLYALGRSGAFEAAVRAVEALGPWAIPAFIVLHIISVIGFVPSVAPAIAAGALFGITWGFPISLVGAGIGALSAFYLGRTTGRAWVERRFSHDLRFEALSNLARKRGWKIVALARLTPIFPFSIANYAFGVTSIHGRVYIMASMLGTIPSNAVYVYLGAVAGQVAASGDAGRDRTPLEWALLIGGLFATVGLAVYLRRVASEVLEKES
jgi:uncharacterized membrane protein YdjX (TVP38/TMEM64 family)